MKNNIDGIIESLIVLISAIAFGCWQESFAAGLWFFLVVRIYTWIKK